MDNEKQKDEITVLESIYNKEEFSYIEVNGQYECMIKISVALPNKYYFTCKTSYMAERSEKVSVSYLPPLVLSVVLPADYPSKSPPKFILRSTWLGYSALTELCKELDKLWEKNHGVEILFTWMNFLQEETLSFLKIQECININIIYAIYELKDAFAKKSQISGKIDQDSKHEELDILENTCSANKVLVNKNFKEQGNKDVPREKRAILDISAEKNPAQMLVDYNETCIQIEFRKKFYTCKICFDDKLGEHCTQFLPCTHVFCKSCIVGYLETRIKDCNVQNILCPTEKCTSEATPSQVKELLPHELFSKYDSILLSTTLDTMTDIIYCPRRHCQYPVSREPNESMASCPVCEFTFCIFCKMVYHGIEPCKVNTVEKQKLLKEYQSATGEKKLHLEQRYGKKILQNLVENTMSETWINQNSLRCPHCNAAIEKSDGCNKMTCWKCNTYFCWLCQTRLNRQYPYRHYQDPQSKCYNLLYHGLIPHDNDIEDNEDNDEQEYHDYHAEYWAFLMANIARPGFY